MCVCGGGGGGGGCVGGGGGGEGRVKSTNYSGSDGLFSTLKMVSVVYFLKRLVYWIHSLFTCI